jgi:hypothetical protein
MISGSTGQVNQEESVCDSADAWLQECVVNHERSNSHTLGG